MAADKQVLRRAARKARSALSPAERKTRSAAACLAALELLMSPGGILSRKSSTAPFVALYAPLGDELDPVDLDGALRKHGVQLVYPRVLSADRSLRFHRVDSPQDLHLGTFGLREPACDQTPVPITSISSFIVPGLAFDTLGNRLGWGKGYYDTALASHRRAFRIGLAFDCQLVAEVPVQTHDLPMHALATESGAVRISEPA